MLSCVIVFKTRENLLTNLYCKVKLSNDLIIAQLATGKNKGKYLMISRFKFQSEDKTVVFQMERNQFPIKLAFGITANRSQGQTYKFIGTVQNFFLI